MVSLKSVARELRDAASQMAEARVLNPDELPCQQDALLLFALAALKGLEAEGASSLGSSSSSVAAVARSARHTLRPYLSRSLQGERAVEDGAKRKRERTPKSGDDAGAKEDEVELGQYAKTHVFDGNEAKRSKFARLMGGGRQDEVTRHNTFAADANTLRRINNELEDQFNAALNRNGKKGLGA